MKQSTRFLDIPLCEAMAVSSFYTFEPEAFGMEDSATKLTFRGEAEFKPNSRLVNVSSPVLSDMIESFLHKQQKLYHKQWLIAITEKVNSTGAPLALSLPTANNQKILAVYRDLLDKFDEALPEVRSYMYIFTSHHTAILTLELIHPPALGPWR